MISGLRLIVLTSWGPPTSVFSLTTGERPRRGEGRWMTNSFLTSVPPSRFFGGTCHVRVLSPRCNDFLSVFRCRCGRRVDSVTPPCHVGQRQSRVHFWMTSNPFPFRFCGNQGPLARSLSGLGVQVCKRGRVLCSVPSRRCPPPPPPRPKDSFGMRILGPYVPDGFGLSHDPSSRGD